jgi:hypothetical protein
MRLLFAWSGAILILTFTVILLPHLHANIASPEQKKNKNIVGLTNHLGEIVQLEKKMENARQKSDVAKKINQQKLSWNNKIDEKCMNSKDVETLERKLRDMLSFIDEKFTINTKCNNDKERQTTEATYTRKTTTEETFNTSRFRTVHGHDLFSAVALPAIHYLELEGFSSINSCKNRCARDAKCVVFTVKSLSCLFYSASSFTILMPSSNEIQLLQKEIDGYVLSP